MSPRPSFFALLVPLAPLILLAAGCGATGEREWIVPETAVLTEVAASERQWTGLAITRNGRIFVNYPLWSAEQEFAVGEIGEDGTVRPYPNPEWNSWRVGKPAEDHFVCVQALLAPGNGQLWILDPANPRFEGIEPGGPKLVVVDLASNEVERVYIFEVGMDGGEEPLRRDSYLNDLRVDLVLDTAYLTDSGDGAIIVLDLDSGDARRLLDGHPSTQAEPITLTIDGEEWRPGGTRPQVHSDGIALSPDEETLYFQALTGRTLYSVPTDALRDPLFPTVDLFALVTEVADVGPSDGLICGPEGAVYLTSLEENAIRRVWPHTGKIETVIADPRISWPDSQAVGPDGHLHFTTAQIHRGPNPPEPYRVYRIDRAERAARME